jgi:hypothetical protein
VLRFLAPVCCSLVLGHGRAPDGSAGSRIELCGETNAVVRRVLVRFRHGTRVHRRRATLVEARDARALRAARIGEPFGYFIALVPAGARDIVAEGWGADRRLGTLRFDPIVRSMHPRVFISAPR